ncbi:MAG: nickel-dependent lactate racemase [Candidatus Thermoplasmatota archaeon]|nr:nickel-dependent lactate racemase [Candidatus Thermoplasmatota archaeon]
MQNEKRQHPCVDIPYGTKTIAVQIPAAYEIAQPPAVTYQNEKDLVEHALRHPLGKEPCDQFIKNAERLLVIVNDAMRPTPTAHVLEYLSPFLSTHPHVTFLVATGTHRAPTAEELRLIFGRFYEPFKHQIVIHNAKQKDTLVYLGRTKRGTEVSVNKLVTDIKTVLVIGSVEPHYFAGFTGGRKAFLPGVSAYETVEMNHKFALSEQACSLQLQGNPVHEDMLDAVRLLQGVTVFSLQAVVTPEKRLYAVTAGDVLKSFDAAIPCVKEVCCVPLTKKGNIVMTVAPHPMDVDLYQSQKALENGKFALETGGIIILVSTCRMGVGDQAFLDMLCQAGSPQNVLEKMNSDYTFGYHKAAKIAQLAVDSQIWAVTDLSESIVQKAFMKPYRSLQAAMNDAVELTAQAGKQPHVVILPQGSLTIPVVPHKDKKAPSS